MRTLKVRWLTVLSLLAATGSSLNADPPNVDALIDRAGISKGICGVPGCGNGALAVALAAKLPALENAAIELLAPPPTSYPDPTTGPRSTEDVPIVREGSYADLDRKGLREAMAELEDLLGKEPAARLLLEWKLRREVSE